MIRHAEEIVPIAPYSIDINSDLEVAEKEDFELQLQLSGNENPSKLFIEINGSRFLMKSLSKSSFQYVFRSVQQDVPFRIYGSGFFSETFTLRTLPKPLLLNFTAALDYPAYTRIADEQLRNSGDITVPEGTEIVWDFETVNTNGVFMNLHGDRISLTGRDSDHYTHRHTALSNAQYVIRTQNAFMKSKDSIAYRISVIPDVSPAITANEERDSLSVQDLFFTGEVKDDYGFTRLQIKYTITASEASPEKVGKTQIVSLDAPKANSGQFFYHWQLKELNIQPGDQLSYFFEVWDNDQVNGSKSSRTVSRVYAAPTLDELEEQRDEKNEDLKNDLEESIDDAKKLQEDLDRLREDLLNKKEIGWQEKKKMEEILKQQKDLEKKVEEIQNKNQKKDFQESQFNQQSEQIQEKQKHLQELFDQVMSDEMKEMMEEMQKMMEELNKEELQEQIEQMNMSNEDLEKELDRALEQFKQLEWEMKMEDTIDEQKDLAKHQEE